MRIVFAIVLLLTGCGLRHCKGRSVSLVRRIPRRRARRVRQLLLHDDRAMPRHNVRVGGYCTPKPFYSGPPVRDSRHDAVPATTETGLHAHRRCMILVV